MHPVIVLHHHEIVLKGGNRKYFEQTLMRNVRATAAAAGVKCSVSGGYGKFILTPGSAADAGLLAGELGRVFGLANICPGVRVAQDVGALCEASEASLAGLKFATLRVDTRRVDKRFPLTSMETNARIGARLCGTYGVRADLSDPDVTVSVEIADGTAYVYSRRLPGAGGLPAGVSGRVVGLLSAGFDSPVACWQMMKRGCNVVFVHFHSMPYTGEQSVGLVRDVVRVLTPYQYRSKLYLVPFAPVQNEIVLRTEPSLRIILYRRMMLRIAERIAGREKAEGLVTGEAVGQVASQTLRNIRVIDAAATIAVLRPLSGADKEETIATSRRIGTHDFSSQPYDDCCSFLAPRSPRTWADPAQVLGEEAKLDLRELTRMALSAVTIERFHHRHAEPVERSDALHA